jgi:hypothetical protein
MQLNRSYQGKKIKDTLHRENNMYKTTEAKLQCTFRTLDKLSVTGVSGRSRWENNKTNHDTAWKSYEESWI